MKQRDIIIVVAAVGAGLLVGLAVFCVWRCCKTQHPPHPHVRNENQTENYTRNSDPSEAAYISQLREGTNDGLTPGRYWGLTGAPWQVSAQPAQNLRDTNVQESKGWGWGLYQIPFKKSWWSDEQYGWYFDPRYWRPDVAINTYNLAEKMCVDRYKKCVDSLGANPDLRCVPPFEACMASVPHMDESEIGHG
jgi:hypothetical protein